MNKLYSTILFMMLALGLLAQSGKKMTFQGSLYKASEPFNGTANLQFTIALDSGKTWTETFNSVSVVNGLYSVALGTFTALPEDLFFNVNERTLNITVDGVSLGTVKLHAPFESRKGLRALDELRYTIMPIDTGLIRPVYSFILQGSNSDSLNTRSALLGMANTTGWNRGVEGIAISTPGNNNFQYGVYGRAYGEGSGLHYAVRGESFAQNAWNVAVRGMSINTNTADNFGGWFSGRNSSAQNIGIRADASGDGKNIGIWSSVTGGTEAWAGWFDGNMKITGDLDIDGKIIGSFYSDNSSSNSYSMFHTDGTKVGTLLAFEKGSQFNGFGINRDLDPSDPNYAGGGASVGAKFWEDGNNGQRGYLHIRGTVNPDNYFNANLKFTMEAISDNGGEEAMFLMHGNNLDGNGYASPVMMMKSVTDTTGTSSGNITFYNNGNTTLKLDGSNGSAKFGVLEANGGKFGSYGIYNNEVKDWQVMANINYWDGNSSNNGLITIYGPRDQQGEAKRVELASYGPDEANSYGEVKINGYQGTKKGVFTATGQSGSLELYNVDNAKTVDLNGADGSANFAGNVNVGSLTINGEPFTGGTGGTTSVTTSRRNVLENTNVVGDTAYHFAINGDNITRGIQMDMSGAGAKFGIRGNTSSQAGDATFKMGVVGSSIGEGEGRHEGVRGQAAGKGQYNWGVFGIATGAGNGVTGYVDGSYNTGVYGTSNNNTWGNTGVFGEVTGTIGEDNNGIVGLAKVGAEGNTAIVNQGVLGRAEGPGVNKGVVGMASGGAENWAGWFDGKVKVSGSESTLELANSENVSTISLNGQDGKVNAGGLSVVNTTAASNNRGLNIAQTVDANYTGQSYASAMFVNGEGSGTGDPIGLLVNVNSSNRTYNTGIWAVAQGTGSANYAIYGQASNGSENWAGWFQGDINVTGNITYGGTSSQSSDLRLKTNIKQLDGSLDKVLSLRGVSYNWIDPSKTQRTQIGVIAQEVEEIYPEFVYTDNKGMKSVNYAQMTAVLIEAVKGLNAQIEQLKLENKDLEAKVADMKDLDARLTQIEKLLKGSQSTDISSTSK